MSLNEELELATLIQNENGQCVMDVFSSKAFGWIARCHVLSGSEVEEVVLSLNLNESDASAVIYFTLLAVLNDMDEHEEYSEDFGSAAEIKKRIDELKKKIDIKDGFKWEVLYKLSMVLDNAYDTFSMEARELLTNPQEIEFLKMLENKRRKERPDIILNQTDFSFMSPLLDEAVCSLLAESARRGASNFSKPEERILAEKTFEAFEYYVTHRPTPQFFATEIVTQIIQMTARWENAELAKKVAPYIDKVIPNVFTYTSLCRYYSTYNNRDKLVETLKIANSFGADDDLFDWATRSDSPWINDEEVQSLVPKSIFDYPLEI